MIARVASTALPQPSNDALNMSTTNSLAQCNDDKVTKIFAAVHGQLFTTPVKDLYERHYSEKGDFIESAIEVYVASRRGSD